MKLKKGKAKIEELLDAIKDTDIEEVYYKKSGLSIGFKKNIIQDIDESESDGTVEAGLAGKDENKEIIEITSHSVGVFRDALPPARKVMAKVGQVVNKGQKIGFIESMKIMKDVISPIKGTVVEKYIKGNDPVEYGQKLFEIEIV